MKKTTASTFVQRHKLLKDAWLNRKAPRDQPPMLATKREIRKAVLKEHATLHVI